MKKFMDYGKLAAKYHCFLETPNFRNFLEKLQEGKNGNRNHLLPRSANFPNIL